MLNPINIETNSFNENKQNKVSLKNLKDKKQLKRPQTPHLDFFEIREVKKAEPDQANKNFNVLMKQIIETGNENFLNGHINLIEHIISKYLNKSIEEIKDLEKFSMKINSDFGLLNQFGQYLPNLIKLKLNNSIIPSISEIGSSFSKLKILHVNNCNLKDLSGK